MSTELVFCDTCYRKTGKGSFDSIAEHDGAVGSGAFHALMSANLDRMPKASWVALCPKCGQLSDVTAWGFCNTYKKHATVAVGTDETEVIDCGRCHTRYQFNLNWQFGSKALPARTVEMIDVHVVADPQGGEVSFYGSRQEAEAVILDLIDYDLTRLGISRDESGQWVVPLEGDNSGGQQVKVLGDLEEVLEYLHEACGLTETPIYHHQRLVP